MFDMRFLVFGHAISSTSIAFVPLVEPARPLAIPQLSVENRCCVHSIADTLSMRISDLPGAHEELL